ncbi:hypothetical protein HDU81_004737 [Chytriomyces hyalinus]|nr:hypothetical protein HDU81_004737 [Chytriomyces hyalinus]
MLAAGDANIPKKKFVVVGDRYTGKTCMLFWLPEVIHHCKDAPFLLVALETDLRNDPTVTATLAKNGQSTIQAAQPRDLAAKIGAYRYVECSARNHEGVQDVFEHGMRAAGSSSKQIRRGQIRSSGWPGKGKGKIASSFDDGFERGPNNKKHKVSKIKGAEKAHPFSRKAAQLRRAFAREERVAGLKTMKDADRTRAVDRMVWFKYAIPDEVPNANLELVHDLIDQYINRNEDEIEELKATIRPNRQRPPKIALLEMLQGKDRHEYATGMRVPDMCDAANVARLRKWEGDYNGIGAIKMVSITEASRRKVEEKAKENEDAMEAADADEE